MGDPKKKPEPLADDTEGKEGAFLETMGCLMIFGGQASHACFPLMVKVPHDLRPI
jgi:hypothetical protein